MASFNTSLSPPAAFPFDTPDQWPKWKRRFEQYRVAAGLSKESQERQVNTLLYCLGEEAEDILASTNISDDDRKQYDAVLSKFDSFFRIRKNVIIERAKFNRRSQLAEEPAEQFIASLYNLAADCNFGDLKDELIRDRIVVGIRDAALSERLQMDPELTLEKAKTLVRQREAIRDQQQVLNQSCDTSAPVEAVKSTQRYKSPNHRNHNHRPQPNTDGSKKCFRCGKSPHPRDVCPAKDATCRKCKKKGHFSVVCHTKPVQNVSETNQSLDSFFLNTVDGAQDSKSWTTQVSMNQVNLHFKLDTGAEVTAISEKAFKALGSPQVQQPTKKLCGPTNTPLKVKGRLTVSMTYKNNSCEQEVFVVNHLQHNLLGLPAIKALHLLTRVESVTMASIHQEFSNLFTGLGTLQGEPYHIHLKPEATPFSLGTARNISLSLRDKVQESLNQIEAQGVISKVHQPTPWCAGMVVVSKRSGGVRICVDLKPLNRCVLRERHPLPRVDDTLAQLTGATTFSKLDANSGFWQIPLSEESKLLTTFITPFGRYCYNKLPFGISSAPEHFQRRMSCLLEGLQGVLCVMDNIIVFGKSQQEHDSRLHTVLSCLSSSGITLNRAKCEFSKNRLIFLGHVIDPQGISPDPSKTTAISQMDTPKSVPELCRFLWMVNQLENFSLNIAELSCPLRELLSIKRAWSWGSAQAEAFSKLKQELISPHILAFYDQAADTIVSANASSHSLGAVLL